MTHRPPPAALGDVLVACLREPDPDQVQDADLATRVSDDVRRAVATSTDLRSLPPLARFHGVSGYAAARLHDVEGLAPDIRSAMDADRRHDLFLYLRYVGALAHLHAAMIRAGIPWAVAGGPVLIDAAYPRPDLRACDDAELFLPADAVGEARRLLEQDGARWQAMPVGAEGAEAGAGRLVLHGARLVVRPVPGGPRGDAPWAGTLDRAQTVTLDALALPTLDTDDTLIAAAMRAADDAARLGPLKDVDRLVRAHAVRWDRVAARVEAWGYGRSVVTVLRRARMVLQTPVPRDAVAALPRSAGGALPARRAVAGAEATLLHLLHLAPPPVAFDAPVDGEGLLALAARERVAPLAVQAADRLRLPPDVVAALRAAYCTSAAAAAGAAPQVARVLHALAREGVRPVLLKGAALAPFVYRDPALRTFDDLDVLVRPEEIDAVHRGLARLGYAIHGGPPTPADRTWRHARGYYDPAGRRMPVDVHWRHIGYPYLFDLDYPGVFARAGEVAVGDAPAWLPAGEDLIVAGAAAVLREFWYGKPKLRYLRDLAEVADRCRVDWARVLRVPQAAPPFRTPLYLALAGAAWLLGAPVPAEVLEALRPRRWPRLGRRALHAFCRNALRREAPVQVLGQMALMRWMDDAGPIGLIRWLAALVFVPRPLAPSRQRWLRRLWRL